MYCIVIETGTRTELQSRPPGVTPGHEVPKSQGSETCVTGDTKLYEITIHTCTCTPEERQAVQNQISHTSLLPFFSNKILLTRKSLSLFEQGTIATIIT